MGYIRQRCHGGVSTAEGIVCDKCGACWRSNWSLTIPQLYQHSGYIATDDHGAVCGNCQQNAAPRDTEPCPPPDGMPELYAALDRAEAAISRAQQALTRTLHSLGFDSNMYWPARMHVAATRKYLHDASDSHREARRWRPSERCCECGAAPAKLTWNGRGYCESHLPEKAIEA